MSVAGLSPGLGSTSSDSNSGTASNFCKCIWGNLIALELSFLTWKCESFIFPLHLLVFFFFLKRCLLKVIFYLFFWLYHETWRILAPWLGIKPMPLAVEAWILNHWTARKVPLFRFQWPHSTNTGEGIISHFSLWYIREGLETTVDLSVRDVVSQQTGKWESHCCYIGCEIKRKKWQISSFV